ncbi:MAG: hypothetical protein AB1465_06830 [Patescibacteria group bacterium]
MIHVKVLICLLFLLSCTSGNKNDYLEKPMDNNQGIQNQSALEPDPGEAFSCGIMTIQGNLGYGCLLENFFLRLRYSVGKFINCPCFPFDVEIFHTNIDAKKFTKSKPNSLEEAEYWIENKKELEIKIKSVINIHLGFYEDAIQGRHCFVIWITSGYLKMCKNNPGKTCLCINRCLLKLKELKKAIKQEWEEFRKKDEVKKAVIVGEIAAGIVVWLFDKAYKAYKCWKFQQCEFGLSLSLSPSGEDFDDDLDNSNEPDEPDNEPVEPIPLSNGCGCNNPQNDGNICFDDSFGKPNPAEYKLELTVVGRDENYLYIFGKDAQLYSRAIFWSDPNNMGLENCESWGQWDGTFMVFKLQPCRTWFALTNENYAIWLSPDSQTTRVAEGVSVVPYGNGHNFTLTCGAEPNDFNLLKPQDYKNSECNYFSLDEALYANKNVCFDDTIAGAPLPSNVKPELTVVARRANYIHVFGANAEIFHHGIFWADPNPNGLANYEINGEYNGFSMVYKLPPCRPWFALSNDEKTIWLSPNANTTRVEDGVSIVFDGQNYNFVLTCGAEPNDFNILSDKDFIKEKDKTSNPEECMLPDHYIVSRVDNKIKLEGIESNKIQAANFWAWPNDASPYDIVSWGYGNYDGCSMWFSIPEKQNPKNTWRFVLYENDQFAGLIWPGYATLEISTGLQIADQDGNWVFEIQ